MVLIKIFQSFRDISFIFVGLVPDLKKKIGNSSSAVYSKISAAETPDRPSISRLFNAKKKK